MESDLCITINRPCRIPLGFYALPFAKKILALKDIYLARFEFTFVTNHDIQTIHRDFLNDDTPTDVITFSLGEENLPEGDIYISIEQAQLHAQALGHSLKFELKTLIVHGILHVLGYTDDTEASKSIMFKEQDRLLSLVTQK